MSEEEIVKEKLKELANSIFDKLNDLEKAYLLMVNNEKNKEIERLNNIINEMEKHINSMCFGTIQEEEIIINILNKLKELKENNNE